MRYTAEAPVRPHAPSTSCETSPSPAGGEHTTMSRTPATRAATTPITTVLGYGARPPGTYTAALSTGALRTAPRWLPNRAVRSSSKLSSTTRPTFSIIACSPSWTSGSSPAPAASSSWPSTRSGRGSAPCVSRARTYSLSASSPPDRTAATISATMLSTDSGAGTNARSRTASACSSPLSSRRSDRIQALQEGVERPSLELVGDRVGDQPGRALGDLLAHLEAVLPQSRAGRGQIDDPLDQAQYGR